MFAPRESTGSPGTNVCRAFWCLCFALWQRRSWVFCHLVRVESARCAPTVATAGLLQGLAPGFGRRGLRQGELGAPAVACMCLQVLSEKKKNKTALYALFPLKMHPDPFVNNCSPPSTVRQKTGLPSSSHFPLQFTTFYLLFLSLHFLCFWHFNSPGGTLLLLFLILLLLWYSIIKKQII